jgi:hypothetical protein
MLACCSFKLDFFKNRFLSIFDQPGKGVVNASIGYCMPVNIKNGSKAPPQAYI